MRLLLGVCGAVATLLGVAAVLAVSSGGAAAPAATCTYEQKQARTQSLKRASAALAAARAAYFRRHKSASQRAAYVKGQQKKLKALRAAAACSVPPLPPASDASCNFMLAPNAASANREAREGISELNEGPINPAGWLRSRGSVKGVVLMVDFSDAESVGSASSAETYAPDVKYFDEVSYGRFSISLAYPDRWIRMPHPTTYYMGTGNNRQYMLDAIAAADPYMDFSGVEFAIVVSTRNWLGSGSNGWYNLPGRGAKTAEGEVRFGATVTPDVSKFGKRPTDHEFLHALGLPDLYFDDTSTGSWDPMGTTGDRGPPGTHPIGWHKWRLGWLDPSQLTCASAAGQIEETLTAIGKAGGKKLVLVPTSPSTTYVIEARARVGYDNSICEEGVLVYDVDSQILNATLKNGRGVVAVKGPRRCDRNSAGALHTGEVFEDAAVKVEILARDATAFRVRVTRK
jgi:M6 family metalloprotease-like protein